MKPSGQLSKTCCVMSAAESDGENKNSARRPETSISRKFICEKHSPNSTLVYKEQQTSVFRIESRGCKLPCLVSDLKSVQKDLLKLAPPILHESWELANHFNAFWWKVYEKDLCTVFLMFTLVQRANITQRVKSLLDFLTQMHSTFFQNNLSRLLNTFDGYAYLIRKSFSHGDLMCLPHCTHKSKLKP